MPDPSSPLEQIRALLPQLDGASGTLARHLLTTYGGENADPSELTTGQLGSILGLSRPTIVRFARRLGYAGFSEFKHALVRYHGRTEPGALRSGLPQIVARVHADMVASLEATLQSIDNDVFERCVGVLANAKLVIWLGSGDSGFLAGSADHKSLMVGLPSRVVVDFHQLATLADQVDRNSTVIAISQSGRWMSMVDGLTGYRVRSIPIIAVTSRPESPLARIADHVLVTAARDWTAGDRPFTLRAPQAALLDALIIGAALRVERVPIVFQDPHLRDPSHG